MTLPWAVLSDALCRADAKFQSNGASGLITLEQLHACQHLATTEMLDEVFVQQHYETSSSFTRGTTTLVMINVLRRFERKRHVNCALFIEALMEAFRQEWNQRHLAIPASRPRQDTAGHDKHPK
jgi:hypothetical protein